VSELKVEIVPFGPGPEDVEAAARSALGHPDVERELGGADHRVLSVAPVEPEPDAHDEGLPEPTRVRATVYDYENERSLVVEGSLDGDDGVAVRETVRQPIPSAGEFDAAVAALARDPGLGPALESKALTPYRPMPPLVLDELPDGTIERTVAVGLRPATEADDRHEIVAVKPARGDVIRFDTGAPAAARAADTECGADDAGQQTTDRGTPGRAKVTVTRDGETVWTFVAVRPSVSVGTNGSGVELRRVEYRGKRVLRRAHVPILNVRYREDACGPFRDWQFEEGMFKADGDDVAPGFRLCPSKAETMLESGNDHGNFRGVAVYVDADEVVLVSELEAGWYRYISRWRLHADGTIKPRFGFGAVESSCVCNLHHHHAYWRLDFDVAGPAPNEVREFNDPPVTGADNWHRLGHEIRRRRDESRNRKWQVRNSASGESYTLIPGANDGEADAAFGVGDLWALRHRPDQIDDGIGFTTDLTEARAHLNQFLNGEPIGDSNVVLWYAAHFSHDVHQHDVGHIVGPSLAPADW